MKLPFLKQSEQSEKKNYFLALLLREDSAEAVVFEEENKQIRVIGKELGKFSTPIEKVEHPELLEVLDKVISSAESNLPPNIETHKTLFGVKGDWIEENKIKKEYLAKLKKACEELALTPIGFLVINEAISKLLQEEEGAPVSAILVDVQQKTITASLLRAGKIIETKTINQTESVVETTDKLLHHLENYQVLPARILVLGAEDKDVSQKFIQHKWSKSLAFLHVPQITVLSKEYAAKAVLFGAAQQMGFDVLNEKEAKASSAPPAEIEEPIEKEEVPVEKSQQDSHKKISEVPEEIEPKEHHKPLVSDTLSHFGFMAEEDIAKKIPPTDDETVAEVPPKPMVATDMHIKREAENTPKGKSAPSLKAFLVPLTTIGIQAKQAFGKVRLPKAIPSPTGRFGKLVFIPPAILAIIIIAVLLYIFLLKASVTLTVKPKIAEQNQSITLSTNAPTDFDKNILAAEVVAISEDGSTSTQATGKKEIGEKAKGTVTLYSRLAQSKTFSAGTSMSGPNNLAFTFDKDVTVASSSGDASASPTTASVAVTAKEIGKESNLPSGSKFSIEGFNQSDIVAKNDSAFSGGTKKEVTVVSKQDMDSLTTNLPKTLQNKAKQDLSNKLSGDKELASEDITTTVSKKTFNKKLGDETTSVSLTATVEYEGVAFKKSDIDDYAQKLILKDQKDMLLAPNGLSHSFANLQKKDKNQTTATLSIKGNLIPQLDSTKLADTISGKSFNEATDILLKIPQVSDIHITLIPNIPFLPQKLPKVSKNITVVTKMNE